jgi:hypothetical protein
LKHNQKAPWNIVFQGPTLDYIDYDTKDKTFSKVGAAAAAVAMQWACCSSSLVGFSSGAQCASYNLSFLPQVVPMAYQVMSVLMNYKRTVEDFGKCGQKTGNPYNFPFISGTVHGARCMCNFIRSMMHDVCCMLAFNRLCAYGIRPDGAEVRGPCQARGVQGRSVQA